MTSTGTTTGTQGALPPGMSPPITLRTYQTAALDAIQAALVGARSTMIEMATGTGKTSVFSAFVDHMLAGRFKRALVLAHRKELIDQAAARLRLFGLQVGIERGAKWSKGDEQAVVASVQTLRAARLAAFPIDEFDVIVVDEGHHACAAGYRDIFDHFVAAKILLVTATPDRADGVPMATVADSCAFRYGIADAIRDGHLVQVRGVRVEVPGMDLSKVRQKRFVTDPMTGKTTTVKTLELPISGIPVPDSGTRDLGEIRELHPGDLGAAVIAPEAVVGVVEPLLALAGSRRTVVFAVNVAHSIALRDALRARGATAESVSGTMRAGERAEALRKHQAGEVQYLVNVSVLTEGYDDPAIECVAIARPTQSRTFFAQAAGRGLRPSPGKHECLVLDFVGVSCAFSLVGPEDVLGAALLGPVETFGPKVEVVSEPTPIEAPAVPVAPAVIAVSEPARSVALEPAPRAHPAPFGHVSFTTRAVELVRQVYAVSYKVGRAAGRGIKKAAKAAPGWFARLIWGK